MSRHAITPTDKGRPLDWQKTNPKYEYSPPQNGRMRCLDGVVREVVVWDGGTLADYAQHLRDFGVRGGRK